MTPPFQAALDLVDHAQLGPLASSIAQGRVFGIRPRPDAAPRYLLDPSPDDAPGTCKLWRVGGDRIHTVDRDALVEAVIAALRAALSPYEGHGAVPAWVALARIADVEIRAARAASP